ncbi:hypothetical protein [Mesorhizobium sp. ESP-6-2]|uniref:hypothetical protein n=1 Tax=Mesorhizobium sp. ESP-6-2 TaxID=2876625 RepID=UPI001CCDD4E3|nr:hypothetical protein [Mesorhizobium sp. ESP-6-2]MBZ9807714.1 hypothetical protein [Mesorhizobium sp. ESP-6-2]
MIAIASTWLGLSLVLCLSAWVAKRRIVAVSLPFAVCIAALAVYIPTGSPRFTAPPAGEYQVLGADIQVDVAIYALLKPKDGPAVYYKLPYSTSQANALQGALDGEGAAKAQVGENGGVSYDGDPPVTGTEPKQPETPAISIP